MKYKQLQKASEKECVKRFLSYYDESNRVFYNEHDIFINENENELNHIDIFVKNKNFSTLKIQVVKADHIQAKEIGEYSTYKRKNSLCPNPNKIFERDQNQFFNSILNAIKHKGEKYNINQKKELILLLDNITSSPPLFFFQRFIDSNKTIFIKSGFKEIWFVGRNGDVIKLHG